MFGKLLKNFPKSYISYITAHGKYRSLRVSSCKLYSLYKPIYSFSKTTTVEIFDDPPKSQKESSNSSDKQMDEKQLKDCEKALKDTQDPKEYLNLAKTIYTLKKKLYGDLYEFGYYKELKNIGFGHFSLKEYSEALNNYNEAVKQAKKEEEFFEIYRQLGHTHGAMNNREGALEAFNNAYNYGKTLFSTFAPYIFNKTIRIAYEMADISNNLLEIYRKKKNTAYLKVILWENIQIFSMMLRNDIRELPVKVSKDLLSFMFAVCEEYMNIALKEKKYDIAEKAAKRMLENTKFSSNHYFMARSFTNQALVLGASDKVKESRAFYMKAKELLNHFFETKPQDLFDGTKIKEYVNLMHLIYTGLADCHRTLDEPEECKKWIVEIDKFNELYPLPEDSLVFLHLLNQKAEIIGMEEDKEEEIIKVLQRVYEGAQKLNIEDPQKLAFKSYVLSAYSECLGELEKIDEALKVVLENDPLIKKVTQIYPERLESLAAHYYSLGSLYGSLKKYPESKRFYQKSIKKYKEVGGPNLDMNLDEIYTDMGHIAEEKGNNDEAREYFSLSLTIRKKLAQEAPDPLVDEVKYKVDELTPRKPMKKTK